jgi:NAD(P)-dependent dehydrogenase (short-subunit alcohol dehydrogenase family)
MRLKNKVALITGAAGEIGLATARLFAAEGAKVVLADLNENALRQAVQEIGETVADYAVVDVTNEEQTSAMVDKTVARFGRLDVFVANAGIEGRVGNIADSDVANLKKVLEVNVVGVWLGMHYAIPAMRASGGGSIIITSSGAGVKGSPGTAPYNTSKHAVIGLMRCAALEYAKDNIRVNTVNPGPVDSRMMRSIGDGYGIETEKFHETITAATPLGRYCKPAEISPMMLFLASDEASYCTGSVYMVDGGNAT